MTRIKDTVAHKIRTLRKKANLTQYQLAERASLSEETIGAIERGKFSPKLETLQKIASAFHLSLHQFVQSEEKKSPSALDENVEKIDSLLRVRSLEDLEMVEHMLRIMFRRLDTK